MIACLMACTVATTVWAHDPPTPPDPPTVTSWSFEFGQGRLGAQVSSMTPELRKFMGAPKDAGLLVQKVEADTVAKKAGIAVGDVIIAVDGDRIDQVDDVRNALSDRGSDDRVAIVVVRNKKRRKLTARMKDDPSPAPAPFDLRAPSPPGMRGKKGKTEQRLRDIERRLEAIERGEAPPKKAKPRPSGKRPPRGA
jgi:membrane-associated protease RseP (regulator of RpoE activity)